VEELAVGSEIVGPLLSETGQVVGPLERLESHTTAHGVVSRQQVIGDENAGWLPLGEEGSED